MTTATRRDVAKSDVEAIVSRPYGVAFEYGEDPSEGVLARIIEWPDCFAAGGTRAEAATALEDALRAMAAYHLESGKPIPEPGQDFGGKVLLRLPKTVHRDADRRAKSEGVSLNQWLGSAIARELGPMRDTLAAEGRSFASSGVRRATGRKPTRRR